VSMCPNTCVYARVAISWQNYIIKDTKMRDADHVMKILGMYCRTNQMSFFTVVGWKNLGQEKEYLTRFLITPTFVGVCYWRDTMKLMLTHTQTHGSRSQFLGDLFTIQIFPNLLSLNFSKNPKLLSRITIRIG
jgi:hypothetical protein